MPVDQLAALIVFLVVIPVAATVLVAACGLWWT